MNRRTALRYGLVAGATIPAAALGQDPEPRTSRSKQASGSDDLSFPEELEAKDGPVGTELDAPPSNFREEAGHAWKSYDITRYTEQARSPENPKPQSALVEWIFRTTGSATWHGEKIAVLSAGRAQLRAYHNPRVLRMVDETVARFTKSTADVLSVRVRLVAAQDTRWRYATFNRLKRIGGGSQGQQIWTLDPSEANYIHSQMMMYKGYVMLADQSVRMLNGQTFTLDHSDEVNYVATTQADGSTEIGPQPRVEPLREGVTLRFSPLLTYEGDAIDAAIDLKATTVKRLVRTKVLARRAVGPADLTIDVPEVLESRLNQTLPNFAIGQVLVISAGILPGILQRKTGFMNMQVPGTYPSDTELLAIINVEPAKEAARTAKRRGKPESELEDAEAPAEEPEFRSAREGTSRTARKSSDFEDRE